MGKPDKTHQRQRREPVVKLYPTPEGAVQVIRLRYNVNRASGLTVAGVTDKCTPTYTPFLQPLWLGTGRNIKAYWC